MTTACVKCGLTITAPEVGRRPRFCSVGCRRAEYELRRLQRHLQGAEWHLRHWTAVVEGREWFGGRPERAQQNLDQYRVEVDQLEERMRELLDDPEWVSPPLRSADSVGVDS